MFEEVMKYVEGAIPGVLDFLVDVIWVAAIIIVGMKLIGMLVKFLKKIMEKSKVEPGVSSFLASLVK